MEKQELISVEVGKYAFGQVRRILASFLLLLFFLFVCFFLWRFYRSRLVSVRKNAKKELF